MKVFVAVLTLPMLPIAFIVVLFEMAKEIVEDFLIKKLGDQK